MQYLEVEIWVVDLWIMYDINLAVFGICESSWDLVPLSVSLDHTLGVKDDFSFVTGLAAQQYLSNSAQAFTPCHTSLAAHKRGIDHAFLIELFCEETF